MRFLIVDDDPSSRRLLEKILEPYADCDFAWDGSEAIDAVRLALGDRRPYDLICLDIMMPGIDGHKALERIRQLEQEHGIGGSDGVKVVMTTAMQDSKHCIRSFREGCESYVIKPISQAKLLDQVQALLGELPTKHAEPSEPPSIASAADGSASAPKSGPDGPRFLVVDDDGVCRALIEDIISPYGRCTFAYDGQEAIDAVRLALEDGQPYDLICLDIMMPGTSGHDALQAIRELETRHGVFGSDGVKVIMTTALRESKHCIQSFQEGCECYITKPINDDELLGKMRELGILSPVESQ